MGEIALRLQSAPIHQRVGDARGHGVPKSHAYVVIIIVLQETAVNDVEDVPLVVRPVFVGKPDGNSGKLFFQDHAMVGHIVVLHQHIPDGGLMLRLKLPDVRLPTAAGVGHVEHIAHLGRVTVGVNERDPLCAPPHMAVQSIRPHVVTGAGGGVRALGVDHRLFYKGVLI